MRERTESLEGGAYDQQGRESLPTPSRPNGASESPKAEAACSAAPQQEELQQRARKMCERVFGRHSVTYQADCRVCAFIVAELQAVYDRAVHETRPQWQSIDTAPKDGTPILIAFRGIGVHRVFWSEAPFSKGIGAWCVTDCKYEDMPLRRYVEADVLGWMPLPAPPVSDAKRGVE